MNLPMNQEKIGDKRHKHIGMGNIIPRGSSQKVLKKGELKMRGAIIKYMKNPTTLGRHLKLKFKKMVQKIALYVMITVVLIASDVVSCQIKNIISPNDDTAATQITIENNIKLQLENNNEASATQRSVKRPPKKHRNQKRAAKKAAKKRRKCCAETQEHSPRR